MNWPSAARRQPVFSSDMLFQAIEAILLGFEGATMLTDEELAALPDDPTRAFVAYEARCRGIMREHRSTDGWDSERQYIHAILAFIHEFELELQVNERIPVNDDNFYEYFNHFTNTVDYYISRFRLSSTVVNRRQFETTIYLSENARQEAQKHIIRIRNIVGNIPDATDRQRQNIYDKLAALSEEINRNRTRSEAWTDIWLYATNAVGEGFSNLEPVVKAVERLGEVFAKAKAANEDGRLPPPDRRTLPKPESKDDIKVNSDDEVPF